MWMWRDPHWSSQPLLVCSLEALSSTAKTLKYSNKFKVYASLNQISEFQHRLSVAPPCHIYLYLYEYDLMNVEYC